MPFGRVCSNPAPKYCTARAVTRIAPAISAPPAPPPTFSRTIRLTWDALGLDAARTRESPLKRHLTSPSL